MVPEPLILARTDQPNEVITMIQRLLSTPGPGTITKRA